MKIARQELPGELEKPSLVPLGTAEGGMPTSSEFCGGIEDVFEPTRPQRRRGMTSAVPGGTLFCDSAKPAVPAGLFSIAPGGAGVL